MAKAQGERLGELVEIRGTLQRLGLLTIPEFAAALKVESNAFVRGGSSSGLRWKLDGDTDVVVALSSNPRRKSGVTLVRP